jgi:hypothetical protein
MPICQLASATATGTYVRPSKLNIFIVDVSGSMGWAIDRLATDTIARIRRLPHGDGILIGIFSSEGWHRWPVTRKLNSDHDYIAVEEAIRSSFYVRNMTCFSEIIADTPRAILDFSDTHLFRTFVFMSDGYPVTSNNAKERYNLEERAKELKSYIDAGAVVAYGDYADRHMLSKLASILGVEFVSTDTVEQIGETFSKKAQGKERKRKKVKVNQDSKFIFSMEKDGTVAALKQEDGAVLASETSDVFSFDVTAKPFSLQDRDVATAQEILYGAALALMQDNKVDDALEVLSGVGDVALVRLLSNALTNAELAKTEEALRQAIANPNARFTEGRKPGCLPADDAFDLFDLLEQLIHDDEARFYPQHPDFHYKRIGRRSKVKDGYPTFVADANISVPFARLTGHVSELNLSIGVSIPGAVALPDDFARGHEGNGDKWFSREEVGLEKNYRTNIFRNYALIANAIPTVTKLPVSMSAATHRVLVKHGVIRNHHAYTPGDVVTLDLSRIPVCNKKRGRDATDFETIAALALESLRLGSMLKVFKAKRDELDPQRVGERPVSLTDAQYEYLDACGFRRDGSFSPPTEQAESTDVLDVRVFEVKVDKGSPVSMKDFVLMVEGKKKFNFVGNLMMEASKHIMLNMPLQSQTKALAWLHKEIDIHESAKRQVDASLNARRFAVALTGAWTKHYATDEAVINVDGHPVKLAFRTIQKKI